jgi:hypothetical protein
MSPLSSPAGKLFDQQIVDLLRRGLDGGEGRFLRAGIVQTGDAVELAQIQGRRCGSSW